MTRGAISRRSVVRGIAASGAVSCLAAARALRASAAVAQPIELRLSSSLPAGPDSAHWVWYDRFQQELARRANGRIKVMIFPNGQLGKESEVVQRVRLGAVDMMISGSSIWDTVIPQFGLLDMGYIFTDWDQVGTALDGRVGSALAKMMEKANVQLLGWAYSFGARNVCSKPAVKTPPELKGLKIRVLPVPNVVTTIDLMGAAATPLPFDEVFTALQTGLIEGLEHDAPTILASKLYEVAKNITLTEHIFNPVVPVIGAASLRKVPSNLHGAFMESATAATQHQRGQAVATEKRAIAELKTKGVATWPIDRAVFKRDVQPLWTRFTAQYPETKPLLAEITSA